MPALLQELLKISVGGCQLDANSIITYQSCPYTTCNKGFLGIFAQFQA